MSIPTNVTVCMVHVIMQSYQMTKFEEVNPGKNHTSIQANFFCLIKNKKKQLMTGNKNVCYFIIHGADVN